LIQDQARTRNNDFKRARAPDSIVTKSHFTEPAWRLLQHYLHGG
jgi:hypothetical protein